MSTIPPDPSVGESAYEPASDEAVAKLRDLTAKNRQQAESLMRGTPPMQLDNFSMLALRFETILNALMPEGSASRIAFEIYFAQEQAKALADAFRSQRQQALSVPRGIDLGALKGKRP